MTSGPLELFDTGTILEGPNSEELVRAVSHQTETEFKIAFDGLPLSNLGEISCRYYISRIDRVYHSADGEIRLNLQPTIETNISLGIVDENLFHSASYVIETRRGTLRLHRS